MKKAYRIKKNEEFQKIISEKNSVANKNYVVYFTKKNKNFARVGISVSKKMGDAVDRNLYKRRLRMMIHETFNFNDFEYDIIIIIRNSFKTDTYSENKKQLENILKKVKIK